jgi:glc operon protein GlcG
MSVTLEQAHGITASLIDQAKERGLTLGIAIINDRAGTVLVIGMDGARPFTADTARGKALGTLLWGMPGARLAGRNGSSIFTYVSDLYGGRVVYAEGSALLKSGDDTVGAVGVSGGTPDVDEELALAAAEAFAKAASA